MYRIYVDEVIAPEYLLVASTISDVDAGKIRRQLKSHVIPGQRRVHFRSEKESRRHEVFRSIESSPISVTIFRSTNSRKPEARNECLRTLVAHSIVIPAAEIVLERDTSLIDRETRFLADLIRPAKTGLSFRHEEPHSEPLLWISDAIGWAYQRGGDWRKRALNLNLITKNAG